MKVYLKVLAALYFVGALFFGLRRSRENQTSAQK